MRTYLCALFLVGLLSSMGAAQRPYSVEQGLGTSGTTQQSSTQTQTATGQAPGLVQAQSSAQAQAWGSGIASATASATASTNNTQRAASWAVSGVHSFSQDGTGAHTMLFLDGSTAEKAW